MRRRVRRRSSSSLGTGFKRGWIIRRGFYVVYSSFALLHSKIHSSRKLPPRSSFIWIHAVPLCLKPHLR